jgi:hypothetical protein
VKRTSRRFCSEGVIHFEEWKEALRERLLLKKIVNGALDTMEHVPFQEIRDYYDTHRESVQSSSCGQVQADRDKHHRGGGKSASKAEFR